MLALSDKALSHISIEMIPPMFNPYLDINHATKEVCKGWSMLSLPMGRLARTTSHQNLAKKVRDDLAIGTLGFKIQASLAPCMLFALQSISTARPRKSVRTFAPH